MSEYDKERSSALYKSLSQPWFYKLTKVVLSPGGTKNLIRKIKSILDSLPASSSYLDIGCGPRSLLNELDIQVYGVDISFHYVAKNNIYGNYGAVASASDLPFADGCIDAVWSIGVFHHLPDSLFEKACKEMQRVCRKGGYTAILDAVFPKSIWRSPIAALLRKLDRGKYVRDQKTFEQMVAKFGEWSFDRFAYAWNDLEAIIALQIKV